MHSISGGVTTDFICLLRNLEFTHRWKECCYLSHCARFFFKTFFLGFHCDADHTKVIAWNLKFGGSLNFNITNYLLEMANHRAKGSEMGGGGGPNLKKFSKINSKILLHT